MSNIILSAEQIEISLELKKNELRLDSRIVADGLGVKSHKDYRNQILEKYETEFTQLGGVLKTTLENGTILWHLNEAQVIFAVNKGRKGLTKECIGHMQAMGWGWASSYGMKKTRSRISEKHYSDALALELEGEREIGTIAGNIDVLTPTQIIEVKAIKQWKAAVGQVLVYSHYYPSHQKRIHLYGETQESFLNLVKSHCDKLGILVTWES